MSKLNYQKMSFADIKEWCVANGKVDWLKAQRKNEPTFIQLKVAFAKEFMPEIMPVAKPKGPTMWDEIDAL